MKNAFFMLNILLLGGCFYAETPDGRIVTIDLPAQSHTTTNKNITINAPPGTTVIYQEAQPVVPIYRYQYNQY
ncbi:hypothetical protein [Neisseria zalophi]|uniref:Methionine-binding protein n=1 Tax=Neisseria zalophi TaxID=640030 RepID=A0A5J6PVP9_9NEIS|nr:hypothetical protein [Neisseria zalophi]QEY26645.1 hypothetical protein D0T92_08965 [Neisseria zalophi]